MSALSPYPYVSIHVCRAIVRPHGSASDNDPSIPLDTTGERVWWLQFVEKDWKNSDITHLRRRVQTRELLLVLGAKQNDGNHQNDDNGGGDSNTVLSLAPGPRQTSDNEKKKTNK